MSVINSNTEKDIAAGIIEQDRLSRDISKINSEQLSRYDEQQHKCAAKLTKLCSSKNFSMGELRQLAWNGIPSCVRAVTWQFLINYSNRDMDARKEEYWRLIEQYFPTHLQFKNIHHQIMVDIPRTRIPIDNAQDIMERILYLWAVRHPGSGYVQGINDLAVPFLCVYSTQKFDFEAETFWSLTKLTEGIQDYYTPDQPGIFRSLKLIEHIIKKTDEKLYNKLLSLDVDLCLFVFRWINNLLLRELPMDCSIRLFDTYLCELDRLPKFHAYVCAELLRFFSSNIMGHSDFQSLMLFLQNLPTNDWDETVVDDLLAKAFCAMSAFENIKFE